MGRETISAILAGVACMISLAFGIQLWMQYRAKRKPHQFWWAVSMLLYSIASFEEFYAPSFGWTTVGYKVYYFAAISLVAVMATGQMYLSFSPKVANVYQWITNVCLLAFLFFLIREPVISSVLHHAGGTIAGSGMSPQSVPRKWFTPFLDGIGGTLLIILPVYSWWKFNKTAPLYVAIGALILSVAGSVTHFGLENLLPLAELLGIAIIFYGVNRCETIISLVSQVAHKIR